MSESPGKTKKHAASLKKKGYSVLYLYLKYFWFVAIKASCTEILFPLLNATMNGGAAGCPL